MKYKIQFLSLLIFSFIIFVSTNSIGQEAKNSDLGDSKNKNGSRLEGIIPRVENSKIQYVFGGEIPKNFPARLWIYRVLKVDPSVIKARGSNSKGAHFVGSPGNPIDNNKIPKAFEFFENKRKLHVDRKGTSRLMLHDSNSRSLEFFDSGAIFYMDNDILSEKRNILQASGLNVNSARAIHSDIAMNFLTQNNLFRQGMFMKNVSFSRLNEFDAKTNGLISSKVTGSSVNFGYKIDGIKSWGPGAKINVYIGENGKVNGYYNALRELAKKRHVNILKIDNVLEKYKGYGKPKTIIKKHTGIVSKISIENVELVYFLESGAAPQEEVSPKYVISGEFTGIDMDGTIKNVEFEWIEDAVGG